MNGSSLLCVTGASFRYRSGAPILVAIDCEVKKGELLCFVGPNGGGKTTLLRGMSGLLPPREGSVSLRLESGEVRGIYGRGALDRRRRARSIAVVLTRAESPGYLRVQELIALGRIPYGSVRRVDQAIVRRVAEHVGVDDLLDRSVGQLSDGERQRVMIARALAQEPEILLLDEPAVHLDPPHQTQLFQIVQTLLADGVVGGVAIATHLLHLALHFGDRILLVADRTVTSNTPRTLLTTGELESVFTDSSDTVRLDPERGWFVPTDS